MRNYLLLVVLLAIAGRTFAQDIWSCGTHDVGGKTGVGLYKNGEIVKSLGDDGAYNFSVSDVIRWNGHTYMAYENATNAQAYIWDYESNRSLFLNPETKINRLYTGDNLYAVGTKKVNGVSTAAQWHLSNGNMVSSITMGDGVYESSAQCGLMGPDGNYYVGGFQYTSSTYFGVIWKNDEFFCTFGEQTTVKDIKFYNGAFYILVEEYDGPGNYWQYIYQNGNLLHTLVGGNSNSASELLIEGGDIYVCGYDGSRITVWKNDAILYSQSGSSSNLKGVWADTKGVYYCGTLNGVGKIWKDGEELYSPSGCKLMEKIYVEEPECTAGIQKMPYFEGFETGDTDWKCWTKIDVDDSFGTDVFGCFASYWDRGGVCGALYNIAPASGEHFAIHRFNSYYFQEGWLISPRIFLQPSQPILSFQSLNNYVDYYEYEGVLVSTDDDPTKLSSYTEVWSPSSVTDYWNEISIDLSAYAGEKVYIAFYYAGTDGHDWLIDDVSVTDGWTPCPPIVAFPYVEEFSSGIPSCWYNFDLDSESPSWGWNGENAGHEPGEIMQKGALFTPYFQLAEGANYTLTFKSYFEGSHTGAAMSRMGISLDKTGVPYFGDFKVIWDDDFPQEGEWRTVTRDLSEYAGHTICLAFAYGGAHAHYWGIDDVTISKTMLYTLTTEAYPPSGGTVDGGGTYPSGTEVTVTAKPAEGYRFDKWNDGVTENPRKVLLDKDRKLIAVFVSTGVDEYCETTLNLSPNPVTNLLRIDGVNPEDGVEIYNSLGMLVKVANMNPNQEIPVGDLASGLYMIRCGNKTARFVKR